MSAELYNLTLTSNFCIGMNFLQWHGPQAQLIITEPDLIKEILNNKDRAYPKAKPPSFLKKLLGDGLAMSEGEKWFKMRKLANHTFHGGSLKVNSCFGFELFVMLAEI